MRTRASDGRPLPRRRLTIVCTLILACCILSAWRSAAVAAARSESPAGRTQAYLARIRADPIRLLDFLARMPKGGDLHHHLTGAVYAESYIDFAVADADCIDGRTFTIEAGPCNPANELFAAERARSDFAFRSRVIDAWSIRDFTPTADDRDVRLHFFAAFAKFNRVTHGHWGEMLAEVVHRAADQHELYLETMLTPDQGAALALAPDIAWTTDFTALRSQLMAAGMPAVVTAARHTLDAAETSMRHTLRCGRPDADIGCTLTLRYQNQILRALPPIAVFRQLLAAFELARADPRVVAVNLVQSQDEYRALHDFNLHMHMLDFFHRRYPHVHITLHAGELTPGEVPPAELMASHIRASIDIGHAERIGHGLDIAYERNAPAVLAEMARRHILVEDCLYSHEVVRGMTGRDNVLPLYLAAHVPVALTTDDEGIVRSELTWYFKRAVEGYGIDYRTLKTMVRNSLEYAFVPGASLWEDARLFKVAAPCRNARGTNDASCRAFLARNERARLEWREERAFQRFEAAY